VITKLSAVTALTSTPKHFEFMESPFIGGLRAEPRRR
jgi:hypothetical protein